MQRRPAVLMLLLTVSAMCACSDDPNGDSCAEVSGVFVPSYQWLEGSCGNFTGNSLTMKSDDFGTVTKVENRLSDSVMTQYIFKGCTISITQEVEAMGLKLSRISGDLHVQEATEMTGKMMRTEYEQDGAIRCNAVYQATFRRQDLIVGGAVTHAATQ